MQFPFLKRFMKPKATETRSFEGGYLGSTYVNNNPRICSNPMVEQCVSKISTTVASLPLHVHVHTPHGTKEAWDHWMSRLLKKPNPEESYSVFFSTIARQLSLYGNAYIRKVYLEDSIVALKIIDAQNVRVDRDTSGQKQYIVNGISGYLTDYDVLHIINPQHGYNGTKGLAVRDLYGGLIDTNTNIRRYLDNAVSYGIGDKVLLKPNGEYWDSLKTDAQEQALVLKTFDWYNKFMKEQVKGSDSVAVAPPHTDVDTLAVPKTAEIQAMEQLEKSDRLIMGIFQIPPEVMEPNTKGIYNTLDTKEADFIYNAVKPICDVIIQYLETLLTGPYFLSYDYAELAETNTEKKMQNLALAVNNGLMSINEARKQLHLDAVKDMDRLILPLNKGYLGGEGIPDRKSSSSNESEVEEAK